MVILGSRWTSKRVIRSNYSHMVAEQCGFFARKVCHAEVAENEQKVEEPSAGMLVEQSLVAGGFERAVGCRRVIAEEEIQEEGAARFAREGVRGESGR